MEKDPIYEQFLSKFVYCGDSQVSVATNVSTRMTLFMVSIGLNDKYVKCKIIKNLL
jgi:hypothetical protein